MNSDNFKVKLSLREAITKLDDGIIMPSVTAEQIDYHVISGNEDNGAVLMVYEKFFQRVGNRITLTVVIDNLDGQTKVHSIGGGAGRGMFLNFDWGASKSFTSLPREIFMMDII